MPDEIIGRFAIEEVKRRVGRGVSYLARDLVSGAPVLLRVFPLLGREGDEWLERLQRLIWELRHVPQAGVVNFGEAGIANQLTYLSRPYLEGVTLADAIERRLDVGDAIDLARRLGDVLAAIHEAGIVHGELKPTNIVLTRRNEVRVVDFGIGFPEPAPPTKQDDLTALGRIVYHMLAGLPPRPGVPADPSILNPAVPPPAGAVVRDLLLGEVTDAAEVVARLTGRPYVRIGQGANPLARDVEIAAADAETLEASVEGAPPGARVANAWFEGDPPFPPLRAGRAYRFCFNIGAPRRAQVGTSAAFVEPDFGGHTNVFLLVSLFSPDFAIDTRQQTLRLWRTGDTKTLVTGVVPRRSGRCRLEVLISLEHELDVLQQLFVDVDVEPAPAAATAAAVGTPRA